MTQTPDRVFYGWWVVLAAAVGLFLGPTPILAFSFGVFLNPLIHEFHSDRGVVSLAFTLHAITVAIALPFAGRLIDRFGSRRVILLSTSMVGFILLSANLFTNKIWQLYLFYSAVGIASGGVAPVAYCDLISKWFDRRRGLALGTMMAGLGAGAMIMPPAAHYLIGGLGWRNTFLLSGVAILLIGMPVQLVALKENPQVMGLRRDGDAIGRRRADTSDPDAGLSFPEAWNTTTFWLVLCAFILVSGSISGCFAHMAAVVANLGLPSRTAAYATSIFGFGMLIGRVGSGILLDRFFAPRVGGLIFGCAGTGIGLLHIAGSRGLVFTAAFSIGIGLGAEVDVMAYLTSRYFGLKSFGVIFGFIFANFGIAAGLGAYAMGLGFDTTGSYSLPLSIFCVATLTGAALMFRLGPYRSQTSCMDDQSLELRIVESES